MGIRPYWVTKCIGCRMEIGEDASAVDGFPHMAAIFLYCKPEAVVNRKIERRQGGRMVSSESINSAFQSSTCLAGKALIFCRTTGPIQDFPIIRGV